MIFTKYFRCIEWKHTDLTGNGYYVVERMHLVKKRLGLTFVNVT